MRRNVRKGKKKEKAPFEMNRFGIWAFLSKITIRQAIDFLKHRGREKRGGGKVYTETDMGSLIGEDNWDLDSVIGELSFHEFDMVLDELLTSLPEEDQSIVVGRMMGYTNREISKKLGCSEKHIRRKIITLRKRVQNSSL